MSVEFTQYLRPYGKPITVLISMPEDIENKAKQLNALGCHFDIEELTTGLISMTCEKDEDTYSSKLCKNGPEVVDNVRQLIDEAFNKIMNC